MTIEQAIIAILLLATLGLILLVEHLSGKVCELLDRLEQYDTEEAEPERRRPFDWQEFEERLRIEQEEAAEWVDFAQGMEDEP